MNKPLYFKYVSLPRRRIYSLARDTTFSDGTAGLLCRDIFQGTHQRNDPLRP